MRDPRLRSRWWRLTHLYKIQDKEGNLITFKPSVIQLMIAKALPQRRRWRILKYRQGGVTTFFCILYLDEVLWKSGLNAAIIAHDQSTLDKIFMIVKRAVENMPEELRPITRSDTVRSYRFEETFDGMKLDSSIYVALKIRGGTVQRLHITERAFIQGEKSRELEAGAKQAVPSTGIITEETTANGFNEYYDAYMEDHTNPGPMSIDYGTMFFAWHEDPQYTLTEPIGELTEEELALKASVLKEYGYELTDGQMAWYRWKQKELIKSALESEDKVGLSGRQMMKQEYPSTLLEAFQSGLGQVFDSELITDYKPAETIEVRKSKEILGEEFKIFELPIPGKFYALGGDPSDGGGDPAGISIWSEDHKKCAEWSGRLRPDLMARLAKEMAELYNNAYAGIENNMLTCILELSKIYDNYFFTVKIDEKRQTRTKKMGWTTTSKSRDRMIDDFIKHFEEGSLENLSPLTLSQMQTFVRKEGGKREHASGKHDDMLFADMIALQMLNYKDKSRAKKRVFVNKAL